MALGFASVFHIRLCSSSYGKIVPANAILIPMLLRTLPSLLMCCHEIWFGNGLVFATSAVMVWFCGNGLVNLFAVMVSAVMFCGNSENPKKRYATHNATYSYNVTHLKSYRCKVAPLHTSCYLPCHFCLCFREHSVRCTIPIFLY